MTLDLKDLSFPVLSKELLTKWLDQYTIIAHALTLSKDVGSPCDPASLDPKVAISYHRMVSLLLRSIKTLHLRIARQNDNATVIAQHLASHPAIDSVFYPGLPDHPGHEIAARQMSGFGGVLSFSIAGGFDMVKQVLPRLRLAHLAANLGSVETVAGPPVTTIITPCHSAWETVTRDCTSPTKGR